MTNRFGALKYIWVRTTLVSASIFLASSLLLFAVTDQLGVEYIRNQIQQQIRDEITYLGYEYQEQGVTELIEETEERVEVIEGYDRFFYTIQNQQNQILFDDYPIPNGQTGWHEIRLHGQGESSRKGLFLYQRLDEEIVLGVGRDLAEVQSFKLALRNAVLWVVASALMMGGIFGLVFGMNFSRKLKHIIAVNEEIEHGNLSSRITLSKGSDEFDDLADSLNRTYSRIQDLLTNLKTVSSGLAHDLKTPLSVIKNASERLDNKLGVTPELQSIDRQVQMMSAHIDSTLLIAELESGNLRREFKPIPLSELIESVQSIYADILHDRGVRLQAWIEQGVRVQGISDLLQRLLVNLFDNMVQHGGNAAEVSLRLNRHTKHVELSVSNTQKAPANGEEPVSPTQNHNLGLRICKAIVQLHFGHWHTASDQQQFAVHITLPTQ